MSDLCFRAAARVLLLLLLVPTAVVAAPVDVGSGPNSSTVVVNFKDGAAYEFRVFYSTPPTGLGLLDVIEANTTLDTVRQSFPWGTLVDGFTYDGHSNVGFGGGDDWWHYWTRADAGSPWLPASTGADGRVATDGSWDGWVYGSGAAPVPEPGTLTLFAVGAVLLMKRRRLSRALPCAAALGAVVLAAGTSAHGHVYVFDPSDFATEVVEYVPGAGVGNDFLSGEPFNNPASALGRPTVDTTGDAFTIPLAEPVPVVPTYAAFRARELVTVGRGGRLTVRFDHPVANDPANPYGLDLIVFGNTAAPGSGFWNNRDPNTMTLGTAAFAEPGIVSVSKDGLTWHTFETGPFADGFAPTIGRMFDPANPDPAVGGFNAWWGAPSDPTRPLDPSVTPGVLNGRTIAEAAELYDGAAGGTAFDLGELGLDWIQYVRIDNPAGSGVTPDIDAFADVAPVPEPAWLSSLFPLLLALRRRR